MQERTLIAYTMAMPSDQAIYALHQKYAKSASDLALVYQHCVVVEAIAMQLLDARPIEGIDRDLVHVGCMLHDIGAYEVLENGTFVQGVRHGVLGEKILINEGFPPNIWRIASHHTGVGLTRQDVIDQNLPVPPADYTAATAEERLVMYADKFHTKGIPDPYFCTFDYYRNSLRQFGLDKQTQFDNLAQEFGQPDIAALHTTFGFAIKSD